MKKALLLIVAILLASIQTVQADYAFYTQLTATSSTGGTPQNLFDSSTSTKWSCSFSSTDGCFVEFQSARPIIPVYYHFTTTNNNNYIYPLGWRLKGKLNADDEWDVIAEVERDDNIEPNQTFDYSLSENTSPYQYFRFEVTESGNPYADMELAGFSLRIWDQDLYYSTMSDIPSLIFASAYPFTPDYTLTDYDNKELTKDTEFTESITRGGQSVVDISQDGEYVVTATGIYPYKGSKSSDPFTVVLAFPGEGTAEAPYQISSTAQWERLATLITGTYRDRFASAHYELTQDISVSTMIGTQTNPFCGTFDGGGHTITANISGMKGFEAPFAYIDGATIKRLTVAGSITGGQHCGGLVGQALGTNTIEDVTVSAAVNIADGIANDKIHHGGVVGHGKASTTTMTRVVFSGSLQGIQSTKTNVAIGGLWGWSDAGATLTMTDCLYSGTYTGQTYFDPIGCRTSKASVTANVTRTYFVSTVSKIIPSDNAVSNEGIVVYRDNLTDANKYYSKLTLADGNDYWLEGSAAISNLNATPAYTGSTVQPFDVTFGGETLTAGTDYSVSYTSGGNAVESAIAVGAYDATVTLTGNYRGTLTTHFAIYEMMGGAGTEDNPYTIANANHWDAFAYGLTQAENNGYSGKYIRLDTDLTISDMVSTEESQAFVGTLDGNNHTLTVSIGSAENRYGKYHCGLFRYVDGATFQNLTITGAVYSTSYAVGGLVGCAKGRVSISNCVSTVTVSTTYSGSNGSADAAGFVGYFSNSGNSQEKVLTIDNCVFAGSLLGNNSQTTGGFVGYSGDNTTTTITHCLFAPQQLTISSYKSNHFVVGGGTKTVTDSYYTTEFCLNTTGGPQGVQVYAEANLNAAKTYEKVYTYADTDYFKEATITLSDVEAQYDYNDGNAIAISPVVTYGDATLNAGTDYTVTYTKNGGEPTAAVPTETGEYTLTVLLQGNYRGTLTSSTFVVVGNLQGEGTEASPYLVATDGDWLTLVSMAASGETFTDKFIKQTADIVVTRMMSSETGFSGTYDGDGNTITANISGSQFTALFPSINGATIHGLTVAGSITGGKHTAALVGKATGTNVIEDVIITATVSTPGTLAYLGGVVGHGQTSNTTLRRVVVSGTINGSNSSPMSDEFIGGLWGWSDMATVTMDDCLFSGTYNGKTYFHPLGVSRQGDEHVKATVTNSYYVSTAQPTGSTAFHLVTTGCGQMVYTSADPAKQYKKVTAADGNTYYYNAEVVVSNNAAFYTGEPITVAPTVTFDGATLTAGTDYDLDIDEVDGLQVTVAGSYNITITLKGNYVGTYSTTYVVAGSLAGTGTEDDPYVIATAVDWRNFAYSVTLGTDYTGKYVAMTADVETDVMAGDLSHLFMGTFDGRGHTLTVNYVNQGEYSAPFRGVRKATIKRLRTAGTITTDKRFAAGLVGKIFGDGSKQPANLTSYITSCQSSVTISSSVSGDGTNGGFAAIVDGVNATFTDCLFDGKLLGTNTNSNGGFVGWTEAVWVGGNTNAYYSVNTAAFNNCLFAPSEVTFLSGNSATFSRSRWSSMLALSNSYYKSSWNPTSTSNPSQGTSTDKSGEDLRALLGSGWVVDAEGVVLPDIFAENLAHAVIGGVEETYDKGADIAIAVALTDRYGGAVGAGNYDVTYTYRGEPVSDITSESPKGEYMVIATGKAPYYGSVSHMLTITGPFEGQGTEESPYEIASAKDWDEFARQIVSGELTGENVGFKGKFFKLMADITVSTIAGSTESNKRFCGTFDGNGKTITAAINSTTQHTAPFGAIDGATIRNLTVAGTVLSSAQRTGGLVGYAFRANVIENCTVSAKVSCSLSGDATSGGFVGFVGAGHSVTIRNSVFNGQLAGSSAHSLGGFVGWLAVDGNNKASAVLDNCLFAPEKVSISTSNCQTFVRYASGATVTVGSNCYYIRELGGAQGMKVLTSSPGDGYVSVTAADDNTYWPIYELVLTDNGTTNSSIISAEREENVYTKLKLENRYFYRDDSWNTVCLPFDVTIEDGKTFEGATARTLTNATLEDGHVTLTFGKTVTTLLAGVPYIIKWSKDYSIAFVNPVFSGVNINETEPQTLSFANGQVQMVGYYDAFDITPENTDIYYMTADNTLRRTATNRTLNACRAYFRFGAAAQARDIRLVYDDGETTGVNTLVNSEESQGGEVYNLQGQRVDQPTRKGLYIRNGRKEVVK